MTDAELRQLLTSANPLPADRAAALTVADAQEELLAGLLAQPRSPARAQPARSARRRRLFPRVGLAIAGCAAVLAVVLSLGASRDHPGSGTAWAAEQVRFAEASPLVLLGAPGWRVQYADEQSQQEGELQFRFGAGPAPKRLTAAADTHYAALNWRGGSVRSWSKDRASGATVATTAPVLGTTAHVYQYEGGTPGHRDITAIFSYDRRVLEFRAGATDVGAFKALLSTLKRVDTDAWLSAMPASVVKTSDRNGTVAQMLKGVTVPPGFDARDIKGANLTKDRYQLGAAVTGTVACRWFKRWSDARAANDGAAQREAVAAMATARHWPILKEMAKRGAYPQVLLAYAAAMPSGTWYGRPLIGDVNEGLGCDVLGVDLEK
jgi:hypothetical protein